MPAITRRIALAALVSALPAAAFAAHRRRYAPRERILVDVSPLRRNGDNANADFFADVLPGYLSQSFGPGHDVRVRIDSVTYGPPGSDGSPNGGQAVDWIEGVGWIDGREVPLTCSVIAQVYRANLSAYGARLRQDTLARSFAQWLPRQVGL